MFQMHPLLFCVPQRHCVHLLHVQMHYEVNRTKDLTLHDFYDIKHHPTDPVAARSETWALSTRTLDRGFESRLRHGCLSSSVYVVLSCVGRGLATS
jgi:hypothetical protein